MRILAIVAEPSTARACLDGALAIAASATDHVAVEALHVIVDPRRLRRAPEEVAFQRMRESREGTAEERARLTRAAFVAWSTALPENALRVGWKELVGAEEETVAREAAQFDLVVMARPHNLDGHDALHAAFYYAARPLLLVPSDWKPPSRPFPQHVAIAWNGKPQACRAVDGAMPWIRKTGKVTIILIAEKVETAGALTERLSDEGIAVCLHVIDRDARSLGDQIIDAAGDIGADVLVMGAYRHGEFVEWLLGGTTVHALNHANLPLLMAH